MSEMIFNEGNTVFRIGVLSDPHISYEYYTENQLADSAASFTRALAALRRLSEDRLDAVIMTGDYTSLGCAEQVETFASILSCAVEGIFCQKKPKLAIGYGNHDTCWGMSEAYYLGVEGWEKIYRKYGLLDDCEPDSAFGKGGGSYHIRLQNGDKVCHILVLEIDDYPPNAFYSEERLRWIDNELSRLTAEEPSSFIFVGAHSPIKESGVFGTDMRLDLSADWAKSTVGGIHEVLKKYPQVVFFSGHTHYADLLESTIMCRDYTAVNVPSSSYASLWGGSSPFIDDGSTGAVGGMALYLEVNSSGDLRIRRALLGSSSVATENGVTTAEVPNPNPPTAEMFPTIYTLRLNSCRYVDGSVALYGAPWCIAAPKADKSHLLPLSDERGKTAPPAFSEDSRAELRKEYDSDGNERLLLGFPAAVSSVFVHHYVIRVTSEGSAPREYWAVGNWCGVTTGVEDGTSHLDAARYRYLLPADCFAEHCRVTVTPIDEYAKLGSSLVAEL